MMQHRENGCCISLTSAKPETSEQTMVLGCSVRPSCALLLRVIIAVNSTLTHGISLIARVSVNAHFPFRNCPKHPNVWVLSSLAMSYVKILGHNLIIMYTCASSCWTHTKAMSSSDHSRTFNVHTIQSAVNILDYTKLIIKLSGDYKTGSVLQCNHNLEILSV